MAKKKNFKDNTFETANHVEAVSFNPEAVDENQIDIEDQIKDEEKLPQFKKVKGNDVSHTISGTSMVIDNSNITHKLKDILISKGICTEKDFK